MILRIIKHIHKEILPFMQDKILPWFMVAHELFEYIPSET